MRAVIAWHDCLHLMPYDGCEIVFYCLNLHFHSWIANKLEHLFTHLVVFWFLSQTLPVCVCCPFLKIGSFPLIGLKEVLYTFCILILLLVTCPTHFCTQSVAYALILFLVYVFLFLTITNEICIIKFIPYMTKLILCDLLTVPQPEWVRGTTWAQVFMSLRPLLPATTLPDHSIFQVRNSNLHLQQRVF